MKDRTNAGKAKEMRHSSMLNNPNINNSIINKILNVGEIDYLLIKLIKKFESCNYERSFCSYLVRIYNFCIFEK